MRDALVWLASVVLLLGGTFAMLLFMAGVGLLGCGR